MAFDEYRVRCAMESKSCASSTAHETRQHYYGGRGWNKFGISQRRLCLGHRSENQGTSLRRLIQQVPALRHAPRSRLSPVVYGQ